MENNKFTPQQQEVLNSILNMTSSFHEKDLEGVMSSYERNAVIVWLSILLLGR
jgi:hypothetical protein